MPASYLACKWEWYQSSHLSLCEWLDECVSKNVILIFQKVKQSLPVDWQLSISWLGFSECSSSFSSSSCESSDRLMLPINSLFRDMTNRGDRLFGLIRRTERPLWRRGSYIKIIYKKHKEDPNSPSSRALLATFSWSLLERPIKSMPLSDRKSIRLCPGSEDLSSVKLSLSRSVDRHKALLWLQLSDVCDNNKFFTVY